VRDLVLLVTESDGPTKHWPADRWATVAGLVRRAGGEVRGVVRAVPRPALLEAGVEAIVAPPPGGPGDLLSSCPAVLGVAAALTTTAAERRAPGGVLGRERPVSFRPWPHGRGVVGSGCAAVCRAREGDLAYNDPVGLRGSPPPVRTCPVGTPCLGSITPERV